jgi:hypothetical protein
MEQLCAAAKPDKCATRFHEALDAAREIVGSVSGAQAEPGAPKVNEEATKEASAPTPLKGAA